VERVRPRPAARVDKERRCGARDVVEEAGAGRESTGDGGRACPLARNLPIQALTSSLVASQGSVSRKRQKAFHAAK